MSSLHRGCTTLVLGLIVAGCAVEHVELPDPVDRTGPEVQVSRRGRELTFTGEALAVGRPAPDAVLVDRRGNRVRLSDYRGKVVLLSVVPELGTAVCDRSTRLLDVSDLNDVDAVAILTVSTDTWGQQVEWARANSIKQHTILSDAEMRQFGRKYGLLVKETGYLGRCVLVIDKGGVIRRIETQQEMARMPDFAAAEALARELADQ